MRQIVLYGDSNDQEISSILLNFIERNFCIQYISMGKGVFTLRGQGVAGLQLVETNTLYDLSCPSSILILKGNEDASELNVLSPTNPVILDSANNKGIEHIGNLAASNVLTCGFSIKDTATFSSREEQSAVVSIQRPVTLIGKNVTCDPFEIPLQIPLSMHLNKSYSILAATMALVVLGLLDENICKKSGKIFL